ncbi:hypothetical protein [Psychrobacter sp. 16-MNA-CIBAN-0192]
MSDDKPVSSKPNFDIPAPILDSVKGDYDRLTVTLNSVKIDNNRSQKPIN